MSTQLPAEPTVVVDPATSFSAIDRALAQMGLVKAPDTAATPPLRPGEPEFANWATQDGAAQVHYSFNPVVSLRVLQFSGAGLEQWSDVPAPSGHAIVADPDALELFFRTVIP